MPSDNPSRRRRALVLGLATSCAISLAPVGAAVADPAPAPAASRIGSTAPAPAPASRIGSTAPAPAPASRIGSTAPVLAGPPGVRSTRVQAVAPPPAVFRHVGSDGLTDLAGAARPTARDLIAAGCPDQTDWGLLRDGAAPDGRGLCERSVQQARSDVAAAAVVEGFGLLGLPYSRGRRGQEGYADCSSFIGRSYRRAGHPLSATDWEPSSSVMRKASWAEIVDEPLPGDILWRSGHVAIALADGFMMHASHPGEVTHVRKAGRYNKVLAVDPG